MILYTEPYLKRFKAPLCSMSGLCVALILASLLILPFLTSFFMNGFWLEQSAFREQPIVAYQQKYLYRLQGSGSTLVSWSTETLYNQNIAAASLREPTASKFTPVDSDSDGRVDYLSFSVTIPVDATTENVQTVELAMFLDYQLESHLSLAMQTMAVVSVQNVLASSDVRVSGDLRFQQRALLPSLSAARNVYDVSVVNWTLAETDAKAAEWPTIMADYATRDDRTAFELSVPPTWTTGKSSQFKITGRIYFPQDEYLYTPTTGEILKWAWIQYYSFYVLFAAVLLPWMGMLFKNQILASAYVEEDRSVNGYKGSNRVGYTTFQQHRF